MCIYMYMFFCRQIDRWIERYIGITYSRPEVHKRDLLWAVWSPKQRMATFSCTDCMGVSKGLLFWLRKSQSQFRYILFDGIGAVMVRTDFGISEIASPVSEAVYRRCTWRQAS